MASKQSLVALNSLPSTDAQLETLIEFSRTYDPSEEFKQIWGSEFRDRTRELWGASTHAFKEDLPTGFNANEILLCMAFDVSVGPYLGIPARITHAYLQAMVNELRGTLR